MLKITKQSLFLSAVKVYIKITAAAEDVYVYYYQRKREALQIVRDNKLDHEDWIIDAYTIQCFFETSECKDLRIYFVEDGLCPRCQEREYVDKDMLEWQMLCNAITCLCKM